MTQQARDRVADWLESCYTRFENMHRAGLDKNGLPAIQKALRHYRDTGQLTVGSVQYLFNRTDPRGAVPKYNTHRGYNKRHGEMLPCPIKDLVDSGMVDWRSGSNGVIQQQFAAAIRADTRWEYRMGNLRPQQHTTFSDLFN